MKDINYALMLIKANKLDGAKDLLEELLQCDPGTQCGLGCYKTGPLKRAGMKETPSQIISG